MQKLYCPECSSNKIKPNAGINSAGKQRFRCGICGYRTVTPLKKKDAVEYKMPKKALKSHKRFVITSAQNNTPIKQDFLDSLQQYCKAEKAKLVIIPVRYKNPDSFHIGEDSKMSWDSSIEKYLCDSNIHINKNLMIMGDVKIPATAVNPLSGLETISGKESCVFGHAQLSMKLIATPKNEFPKMIHTTGSISEKNYGRSKAGAKGKHHHTHAAIVVETEGSKFWIRQLMLDDEGGFYDLTNYYHHSEGVSYDHDIEALVYGDVHVKHLTESDKNTIFTGKKSITTTLNPTIKITHDVHDHYSGSHHHKKDYILRYMKSINGDDCVRDELDICVKFFDEIGGCDVITSNHHNHLYQWMNSFDKSDIKNYGIYIELMGLVSEAYQKDSSKVPDPFVLYMKKKCKKPMNFVGQDSEYMIKGIDCSQHGDRGANGARPSPNSFAKAGHKMFVGHSHSPCIEKGLWQVGVSSMNLEYQKGLSSWMNCHGGIYPNGKRVLIYLVDGKWRPSWSE